ncbi:hypothetical protein ACLK1S_14105 [Escherichia coli]
MIYPDEAMLYAPVEIAQLLEGFEDIRYEKSTDGIAKITINRPAGAQCLPSSDGKEDDPEHWQMRVMTTISA